MKNVRKWAQGLITILLLLPLSLNVAAITEANRSRHEVDQSGGAGISVPDMASWVINSGDHQNLPFIIVDKINANLYVFNANGSLRASTSVLLGLARGDHLEPGVGKLEVANIPPSARTTPAGRFLGEPGKNIEGERIFWIDYDARLSIHRIRPGTSREGRLERIASASATDNRVSYGCVVVPVSFYERIIATTFGRNKGMIYILPETSDGAKLFNFVRR